MYKACADVKVAILKSDQEHGDYSGVVSDLDGGLNLHRQKREDSQWSLPLGIFATAGLSERQMHTCCGGERGISISDMQFDHKHKKLICMIRVGTEGCFSV